MYFYIVKMVKAPLAFYYLVKIMLKVITLDDKNKSVFLRLFNTKHLINLKNSRIFV